MNTNIEIAIHLGTPSVDDQQLLLSLSKDRAMLAENGVFLGRPRKYRKLIADRITDLQGRKSTLEGQHNFLKSIVPRHQTGRLILSGNKFLGAPSWMLNGRRLYQYAGKNTARLRTLFPGDVCEFFLPIRNPASFIPKVFLSQKEKSYEEFIDGMDLRNIRWSDVLADILAENPGCQICVWCNEDTPFIWPDILREISAFDFSTKFAGDLDIVDAIISDEGARRLALFLEKNPTIGELNRRKVQSIFLEYFADDESVEEEIHLPEWTSDLVEDLTEIYEADAEKIADIPGIKMVTP